MYVNVEVEKWTKNGNYYIQKPVSFKERCNSSRDTHIERELHKIDHCKYGSELTDDMKDFFEKIVVLAKCADTVLELNEAYLVTNEAGAYERVQFWLTLAKNNGNVISLGTDAHYCEEIGEFPNSMELLNRLCFPKEKILNCNE